MTKQELKSYRLTSMEEPTDEMLHAIMLGVQELARESTRRADEAIQRMFKETFEDIKRYKATVR